MQVDTCNTVSCACEHTSCSSFSERGTQRSKFPFFFFFADLPCMAVGAALPKNRFGSVLSQGASDVRCSGANEAECGVGLDRHLHKFAR